MVHVKSVYLYYHRSFDRVCLHVCQVYEWQIFTYITQTCTYRMQCRRCAYIDIQISCRFGS